MRSRHLPAWRCARGHLHLHESPLCPDCGAPLSSTRVRAEARLTVITTVRVTPGGKPRVLAIAQTRSGRARTLCVVEHATRRSGHDAVRLRNDNGVIVASPRRRTRR